MKALASAAVLAVMLSMSGPASAEAPTDAAAAGEVRAPEKAIAESNAGTSEAPASAPGPEFAAPALDVPASVNDCLGLLERLVEYAEAADMLDDHVDDADTILGQMDIACRESRFDDAIASGHKVTALVGTNK